MAGFPLAASPEPEPEVVPAHVLPWSPGKGPYWMKEGWVKDGERDVKGIKEGVLGRMWYWERAEEVRRNTVHWKCGSVESGGRRVPVLEMMDPPCEN